MVCPLLCVIEIKCYDGRFMGLTLSLMTLISRLAGDSAAVLSLHVFGGPRLRVTRCETKGYANQTLVVRKMTRFHSVIC